MSLHSDKNLLLIVFVKNPVPGKVKTRLAKDIGQSKAAGVYKKLLLHTRQVIRNVEADKEIWYAESVTSDDIWADTGARKRVQPPGDLGEKMSRAFQTGFEIGYKKIVIIGSDCIQIKPRHITQAFNKLDTGDIVIGPSTDGGYYLLGMNRWIPRLFYDKPWSTQLLYPKTLETIRNEDLSFYELQTLNDIDTLEDLKMSEIRVDI